MKKPVIIAVCTVLEKAQLPDNFRSDQVGDILNLYKEPITTPKPWWKPNNPLKCAIKQVVIL